jgi:AcrR family transcriptional regulator
MKALPKEIAATERGRSSVEEKLIAAACLLLAKSGPNAVSNRDIAKRAGVNHGQIHHYFGSKHGLLKAAMSRVSQTHWDNTQENGYIPLKGLGGDQLYALAVVRCAIDGELELATQHVTDNISVPRLLLENRIKSQDPSLTPLDAQCAMAVPVAIEMGWAVLEPYIFNALDVKEEDIQKVREHVAATLAMIMNNTSLADTSA